jgi:hypothetical protein
MSRHEISTGIKCEEMIRIALADAAYDAVASALPKGATAADVTRAGPMLHPSRGGGGRPHQGHAQTQRELQGPHPQARRTVGGADGWA